MILYRRKIALSNLDEASFNTTLSKWMVAGEDFFAQESTENEEGEGIKVLPRNKVKRPPRYKVLIHNDDYTTMEFVVWVLKRFFGKTQEQANAIMLKVHNEGCGVCGIYTFEVAETKVNQVQKAAKDEGHPLLCTLEKE